MAADWYRLQQLLGTGSFSQVWKASVKPEAGAPVAGFPKAFAVKIFRNTNAREAAALRRMVESEISLHRRIRHPHIARYFECHETHRGTAIALELGDGGSLYALVRKHKRLEDGILRSVFAEVASAILYLHQRRIANRDIKLENVLFFDVDAAQVPRALRELRGVKTAGSKAGTVTALKLIDFGLAADMSDGTALVPDRDDPVLATLAAESTAANDTGSLMRHMSASSVASGTGTVSASVSPSEGAHSRRPSTGTSLGTDSSPSKGNGLGHVRRESSLPPPGERWLSLVCGSLMYTAPEILEGRAYQGRPVDIWSAGVLLYACAVGTFPFNARTEDDVKLKILRGVFDIPAFVSHTLANLLHGMLRRDPDERYRIEDVVAHPWLNDPACQELFTPHYLSFVEDAIEGGVSPFMAGGVAGHPSLTSAPAVSRSLAAPAAAGRAKTPQMGATAARSPRASVVAPPQPPPSRHSGAPGGVANGVPGPRSASTTPTASTSTATPALKIEGDISIPEWLRARMTPAQIASMRPKSGEGAAVSPRERSTSPRGASVGATRSSPSSSPPTTGHAALTSNSATYGAAPGAAAAVRGVEGASVSGGSTGGEQARRVQRMQQAAEVAAVQRSKRTGSAHAAAARAEAPTARLVKPVAVRAPQPPVRSTPALSMSARSNPHTTDTRAAAPSGASASNGVGPARGRSTGVSASKGTGTGTGKLPVAPSARTRDTSPSLSSVGRPSNSGSGSGSGGPTVLKHPLRPSSGTLQPPARRAYGVTTRGVSGTRTTATTTHAALEPTVSVRTGSGASPTIATNSTMTGNGGSGGVNSAATSSSGGRHAESPDRLTYLERVRGHSPACAGRPATATTTVPPQAVSRVPLRTHSPSLSRPVGVATAPHAHTPSPGLDKTAAAHTHLHSALPPQAASPPSRSVSPRLRLDASVGGYETPPNAIVIRGGTPSPRASTGYQGAVAKTFMFDSNAGDGGLAAAPGTGTHSVIGTGTNAGIGTGSVSPGTGMHSSIGTGVHPVLAAPTSATQSDRGRKGAATASTPPPPPPSAHVRGRQPAAATRTGTTTTTRTTQRVSSPALATTPITQLRTTTAATAAGGATKPISATLRPPSTTATATTSSSTTGAAGRGASARVSPTRGTVSTINKAVPKQPVHRPGTSTSTWAAAARFLPAEGAPVADPVFPMTKPHAPVVSQGVSRATPSPPQPYRTVAQDPRSGGGGGALSPSPDHLISDAVVADTLKRLYAEISALDAAIAVNTADIKQTSTPPPAVPRRLGATTPAVAVSTSAPSSVQAIRVEAVSPLPRTPALMSETHDEYAL